MNDNRVICASCHRVFSIWSTEEKTVTCPFCGATGDNPHYVKPVKPERMFLKKKE